MILSSDGDISHIVVDELAERGELFVYEFVWQIRNNGCSQCV